jgi:hypothetical protein
MKKRERQLWESADALLGGQLFLEEETDEIAPEEVMDDEAEEVDLAEPLPDMEDEETGLTPVKIMRVIDDLAAETEDEVSDEFLKNLSAELEDDVKMELVVTIATKLAELLNDGEEVEGEGEEDADELGSPDEDLVELPTEEEI